MLHFFLLLVSVQAYLEENVAFSGLSTSEQIAVSDNCTVYSSQNGTVLLLHDPSQLLTVTQIDKDAGQLHHFSSSIHSKIVVVNNECDLVLFGFPKENRVALWRPLQDTLTYIVPQDIDNAIFHKIYTVPEESSNATVRRPNISNTVERFGFSLDIQGHSWVVGAPGKETDATGGGGSPGYAFVFEGEELHSCKSMYEMSCYPPTCGSGIEEFVNYYGKLKSPWAQMFIPAYEDVQWYGSDESQLDMQDVATVQKLCLPMELPYHKQTGPMDQQVYDAHREVFQQFGYAVALSGPLHAPASALYISAPGDTSRFMENNFGENYGRVYQWKAQQITTDVTKIWWQPSTPLQLPLEITTYQAFGRAIAASHNSLAIAAYPLYEDTRNPFILLYHCGDATSCTQTGGIAIDDIRGDPLSYLSPEQVTYMDGKTSPYVNVPTVDFQNAYIGNNIGIVGSNIMIADRQNEKIYRFSDEGEWRELHKFLGRASFTTNSEHWVSETEPNILTHYWSCAPGHTGPRHQCVPAQHAYYSDDGWELYSYPCERLRTTTETGRWYCDPWSAPLIPGVTWAATVYLMGIVIGTTVCCCLLVGLWELKCVPRRKYGRLSTADTEAYDSVAADTGGANLAF